MGRKLSYGTLPEDCFHYLVTAVVANISVKNKDSICWSVELERKPVLYPIQCIHQIFGLSFAVTCVRVI